MTTKNLINDHNELARAAGVKEIKVWKESKAKLQARIDALPQPKTKKAKSNKIDGISVADLAREAGKNPKVVRARLRRLYASKTNGLPKPIDESRWIFSEDQRDAVLALVGS